MTLGIVEAFILLPSPYLDKYSTIDKVLDYCVWEFDIYD